MKNRSSRLLFLSGLFLCLLLSDTCKKIEKTMLVATDEATNILTNSADLPGQIIDLGEGATQYGHYYGKASNTLADHTALGTPNSLTGFTSQVTNLEAGTKYYFKAYLTDGQKTVYGKEKTFTTLAASSPTLSTIAITSITLTGAISGGNITSDGGAAVTDRGVCWNSFTSPTTSNNKSVDGTGTGTYSSTLTGLTAGSAYFVRAYATNSAGTTYGNELTFTTTAASVPTVTTYVIANIHYNSAMGGGDIVSDGGSPVLAKGVCWSTATGPTVSNTKTTNGAGTGSFASDISGLSPTTKYYVRAYATNLIGTAYGNEVSFTTSEAPVQLPSLTTVSPTSITSISATTGGVISSDGGSTITQRGVCWNGTGGATLGENQTLDGSGSGTFASTLAGLAPNIKYYVRAYAVNAVGTAYGNEYSFTTLSASSALLTTSAITSITQTTAIGGGSITSDGGAAITARGVCRSLNQTPTLADSYTTNDFGTGIFNSQLTNLSPGRTYFVRAYATNSTGTAYGNQVSFLTASDIPKVTTSAIGTVTSTTAQAGGEVLDNNGSTVTTRGICYNTIGSPTISDNVKSESAAIGVFSLSLTGLTPNTTYYIRAFATNAIGTAYGAHVQFVTPVSSATITTTAVTSVTTTSASSGGIISADGGSPITAKGVCWSISPNPVTGTSTMTNDGTGIGAFTSAVTGLLPNTKYYIRAYAINGVGTTYGDELTFTTNQVVTTVPTLTTTAITAITSTTASSGGNITNDGGAAVTASGVCWGTSSTPVATGNHTTDGATTGNFTSSITGLSPGFQYYVRAYATNSVGTAYGEVRNFVTCAQPQVTTEAVVNYGETSAILKGTVNASGFSTIVTFEYGLTTAYGSTATSLESPVLGNVNTAVTASISGLIPNTLYHYRVVSSNCGGIINGSDLTFTTHCASPSVIISPATNIGSSTVTLNGIVNPNNDLSTVTFEYGLTTTYGNSIVAIQSPINGTADIVVNANVTGLVASSLYHYRIKPANCGGFVYSNDQTFTTLAPTIVVPTLTTTTVTGITSTTAITGGNITNNGGATVTASGVCWSTTSNPVATGSHTTDGAAIGTFASPITGLTLGQTYYVRAYATNSAGTSYGNEVSFTTALAIGDSYQGGIVAYILQSGDPGYVAGQTRGLIAAPNDQSTGATWGCKGTALLGADGTALGTGNQNTTDIVSGCVTAGIAAQLCNDLILGGYSDWYLPSKDELNKLYSNRSLIGGFDNSSYYWTSAEADNTFALTQNFTDGFQGGATKDATTGRVRAIRAFPPAPVLPALSTTAASAITSTTATSGGNVLADGGVTVNYRGVCWNTSGNPTISGLKTIDDGGTGVFTSSLAGLTLGQTYYVRAYATNSVGTAYGNEVSFTTALAIGDSYQGGKVAYILQSGDPGYIAGQTHGLIAALNDQSNGTAWSNITSLAVGGTSTVLGTGLANSIRIIGQPGHTTSAAKICDNYTNIETGTGVFSDWYLPSIDELNKLYINRVKVGGFIANTYWSSSEYDATLSDYFDFTYGFDGWTDKINSYLRVRAIRAF